MNATSELISLVSREMHYRNYSAKTVKTYTSLLETLGRCFAPQSLEVVTTEAFKNYLYQRIKKDKISASMVNQYISAWKIMQTDVLKHDWETIKIKRPRRERKLPVVLSQHEVEALINATVNIKHRAILMLAYSAGLRREEIQLMKPSAIDSERMRVHVVQGKGHKDRYTILSVKVLVCLRSYFKMLRPKTYLFETQLKKGQFLSATSLSNIVKHSAQKAGIKKNISFHTLRHCFATHQLENGVNIRVIQELLGHVSIRTTMVYLHLANFNPTDLSSPLDNMDI